MILMLSACGNAPSTLPTISQDLMLEPCRLSPAGSDSDSDLQADVESAACVAKLRLNTYRWQEWYKASQ
ncbi:hypothetical protein ERHA54_35200 [Erwinia rhapontici]|nr:hypothetical protein ERHA54_35200 [Erwinia rhapontici]